MSGYLKATRFRLDPRPLVIAVLAMLLVGSSVQAQSLEALVDAVVRVKAHIEPDGRTVDALGREREGSGIVIDTEGLVLTIGYLMVEARRVEIGLNDGRTIPATVVGYDHETGFGLVRALLPLSVSPMALGRSSEVKPDDPVLIASFGGRGMVLPARIVAKREFAGNWEYLLEDALFTSPHHPAWSGAALLSREGKLVGVGSLILPQVDPTTGRPGNMFVPIDKLPPILADLIASGRTMGPQRPWLGITADELNGELIVTRVTPGGPAAGAGVVPGARITGVLGEQPRSLAEFYRRVWALGSAGVVVPLDLTQNGHVRRVEIRSTSRLEHLKLKSSL
jgi:S1-C subfamily serine protease